MEKLGSIINKIRGLDSDDHGKEPKARYGRFRSWCGKGNHEFKKDILLESIRELRQSGIEVFNKEGYFICDCEEHHPNKFKKKESPV